MEVSEILGALRDYEAELGDMLGRFTRNRDGLHIDRQDHYRLRILTTELIDILRDHVPGSRQHTVLIMNSYNDGISNFSGSSSYASVEEIRGVVTAVITRVERNKSLFSGQDGLVTWTDERKRLLDAIDRIIERFHLVAKQTSQ